METLDDRDKIASKIEEVSVESLEDRIPTSHILRQKKLKKHVKQSGQSTEARKGEMTISGFRSRKRSDLVGHSPLKLVLNPISKAHETL